MGKPKRPKHAGSPEPKKKPASENLIDAGHPLAWRFSGCDRGGPFCWTNIETADKFKGIVEKLHEFETKPWTEILRSGSHLVKLHRLEKAARDRLVEIQRDDIDDLMSFRITGENRVWCIRTGHIMRVLWWDPKHEVCPSLKKHT